MMKKNGTKKITKRSKTHELGNPKVLKAKKRNA